MADGYLRLRRAHQNISGTLVVDTTGATATLVTARNANYKIYIQRLHVHVTTGAAVTWKFADSASTPVPLTNALDVSTAGVDHEKEYGAEGMPLTAGKNFVATLSATGAAGLITWEGYQRPSATIAATATGTSN